MPSTTNAQKVRSAEKFGGDNITIILTGDTFDDAYAEAMKDCNQNGKIFIHSFDDEKVIEGQATVGLEIFKEIDEKIDYIFLPISGRG